MPTRIDWQLPAGVSAGEIQWPVPEKLTEQDITTYIYKGETVLIVPLKLSPELKPGALDLKAKVSWLECEVQCVPGDAAVQARLEIASERKPSPAAPLITAWSKRLPQTAGPLNPRAWWEGPAKGDLRVLVVEWNMSGAPGEADFFPYASDDFEVQSAVRRLPAEAGKIGLAKEVRKFSGGWPGEISGLLVHRTGAQPEAYEAKMMVADSDGGAVGKAAVSPPAGGALAASPSLWRMLFYAFVGGLILNVMPCVLPVIALKILGFVGQAKDEPQRVRNLGLVYALGVIVSFLGLAALVIAVKAAGQKAGWGMQFGNPQFLVVLTTLVTLVALNLFGLFEVNLGGRAMGAAGTLASRHGAAGAFFNGVLATALATPCTAPLLSAALGFAFVQPAPIIILVFVVIGAGLAFPYVVLSWNPAWLKLLPKPGVWMEKFKIAMGFPMLATAFWLFSLIPIHYGERAWWLGIFLVILALAAWVYGEFVQRGRAWRGLAVGVLVALLAGGYVFVVEGQLRWRQPDAQAATSASLPDNTGGVAWQPWSREAVTAAREAGRPVLVDFTAKWCLTCNTVVKPALESAGVREKLKEINAVALLGDYTRFPPAITDELNRYGRAGVPLVLVYPKDPKAPAIVLPEALTPGMVLAALEKAMR
jgi:thiol:disulfide interchange protein DsbD